MIGFQRKFQFFVSNFLMKNLIRKENKRNGNGIYIHFLQSIRKKNKKTVSFDN